MDDALKAGMFSTLFISFQPPSLIWQAASRTPLTQPNCLASSITVEYSSSKQKANLVILVYYCKEA
jgi:hypothetical protein